MPLAMVNTTDHRARVDGYLVLSAANASYDPDPPCDGAGAFYCSGAVAFRTLRHFAECWVTSSNVEQTNRPRFAELLRHWSDELLSGDDEGPTRRAMVRTPDSPIASSGILPHAVGDTKMMPVRGAQEPVSAFSSDEEEFGIEDEDDEEI
jgi:hypothetical protein